MFYFKKIVSYLDYYEGGEKRKSCGHVKIIVKDYEATVEIQIKGIGIKESRMCDILPIGKENVRIGRFVIDKGTGYFNECFNSEDMDGEGLRLFAVTGIRIPLSEDNYCQTEWEWGKVPVSTGKLVEKEKIKAVVLEKIEAAAAQAEVAQAETVQAETAQKETVQAEAAGEELSMEENLLQKMQMKWEMEARLRQKLEADKAQKEAEAEEPTQVQESVQAQTQEAEPAQTQESASMQAQETLYDDKWTQLCSTYPVCHPFGDDEKYITITPKDFVVLRKEYQNLVSNSFLLHSFYNYHHVILGKMGNGNDEIYYIGAPGNYFDREKRVAVMFGFEGFAKSKTGNDQRIMNRQEKQNTLCGDFGYYMKKVEI